MVKLILQKKLEDKIAYNYHPDGKDNYGVLLINVKSGDIEVIAVADNDSFRRYLMHAVARIEKYFEEKKFLKEDVVAWY